MYMPIVSSDVREKQDKTGQVVRGNFSRIGLIAIDAAVLMESESCNRARRCVRNRAALGDRRFIVMMACLNPRQRRKAREFAANFPDVEFQFVNQQDCRQTVGNAIDRFRKQHGDSLLAWEAKRRILFLSRRGGQAKKPEFVSRFTGGAGTTCGEWTRPVSYAADGTPQKGFMKAAVTGGFCPVGCPFCYLQAYQMDAMKVYLNLEDHQRELLSKYQRYAYPINYCEVSGFVEYDEFFTDPDGSGSLVQTVIDMCMDADVTPFLLTKIRFPDYLKFHGRVQVGISLMPEEVRQYMAPHGSPTDELLRSLGTAIAKGAVDPVVRLTTFWEHRDKYPELLRQCRDVLGTSGWRLTVDLMRFTPRTAQQIAARSPKAAAVFAAEIGAGGCDTNLSQLASQSRNEKKIRPPLERQQQVYSWLREELTLLGCKEIMLTPCKASPEELLPLVRDKTISAMPCACFGCSREGKIVKIDNLPIRKPVDSPA